MFELSINTQKCVFCKACIESCPTKKWQEGNNHKAEMNSNRCVYCYNCVSVCPVEAISASTGHRKPLLHISTAPEIFENFLKTRRTCRAFDTRDIPEEILQMIIRNAKYAPSKSNRHNVKFTVMKGEAIKNLGIGVKAFLRRLLNITRKKIYRILLLTFSKSEDSAIYSNEFLNTVNEILKESEHDRLFFQAPCVILVHADKHGIFLSEEGWMHALQICLTAHAYGIGTALSMLIPVGIDKNIKLKKAIGLTKNDRVIAAVLIGYPKYKHYLEVYREDPEIHSF